MTDTTACAACLSMIDARSVRCPKCAARQPRSMHRNVQGRLAGGVCASLAHQFGWDMTVMRVAFIASLAFTGGLAFWVYALLWLMTPYDVGGRAPAQRFTEWVGSLFSPAPAPNGALQHRATDHTASIG